MANYILNVFPEAIKRKKAWTHYIHIITVTKATIFTSEKEMLMVSTLTKFEGEEPTAIKPVAGT